MKDKAQEQQRLNEIMPRFAPDQAEQLDQTSAWEEFANLQVSPRRSPWSTPGSDDDDLLAQVSDKKVVLTSGNPQVIVRCSSSGYLMAEYTTYQIDATQASRTNEVIVEGASC